MPGACFCLGPPWLKVVILFSCIHGLLLLPLWSRVQSVRYHTFVENDREIILWSLSYLPLIHSRRVVVSYKRKYVHEVLVNHLFKLAQESVWLGKVTAPP